MTPTNAKEAALTLLLGRQAAKAVKQQFREDIGAAFDAPAAALDTNTRERLEAIRTLALCLSEGIAKSGEILTTFGAVERYLRERLCRLTVERCHVLYLDKKNRLIADEFAQGTVDHCPVYPREIAKRALELNASSIVLAHNHPSGDPTPSAADVTMTGDIVAALKTLDIAVHDHIVVGADSVKSLRSLGLM